MLDSQLLETVTSQNLDEVSRLHRLIDPQKKFDLYTEAIRDFGIIVNSPNGIKWGPLIEKQMTGIHGVLKGKFDSPLAQLWFLWNANQNKPIFKTTENTGTTSRMRKLKDGEREFVNYEEPHNEISRYYDDDFTHTVTNLPISTHSGAIEIMSVSEKGAGP